jgi:hypothetical protein
MGGSITAPLTTHNVDKFLNLAYSLGKDLTHLERYQRAKFITLQKKEKEKAGKDVSKRYVTTRTYDR